MTIYLQEMFANCNMENLPRQYKVGDELATRQQGLREHQNQLRHSGEIVIHRATVLMSNLNTGFRR